MWIYGYVDRYDCEVPEHLAVVGYRDLEVEHVALEWHYRDSCRSTLPESFSKRAAGGCSS